MLFCAELGPTTGAEYSIVFLHGFMGDHRDWLPVAESLAAKGHHIILYDLPGHGNSREALKWQNLELFLQDLWLDIQARKKGQLGLVAYSLGARIAHCLKEFHSQDIRFLYSESGSFGISDPLERQERLRLDQDLLKNVIADKQDFSQFLRAWYRLPLFRGLPKSVAYPSMIERRLQQDPVCLQQALNLMSVSCMPPLDESKWEGAMVACTGQEDIKYAAIVSQLKGAWQKELVPEVSHNVHGQKPELVTEIILARL